MVRPTLTTRSALLGGLAVNALLYGGLILGSSGHRHVVDGVERFHSHPLTGRHHHAEFHEASVGAHDRERPEPTPDRESERGSASECSFVTLSALSLEARLGRLAAPTSAVSGDLVEALVSGPRQRTAHLPLSRGPPPTRHAT